MRHFFLFSLLMLMGHAFSFGQYTVKVRFDEVKWDTYNAHGTNYNQTEWLTDLYADIFDSNKNLVVPDPSVYTQWYVKVTEEGEFEERLSGYGTSGLNFHFDGHKVRSSPGHEGTCSDCAYEAFEVYAIVTINSAPYTTNTVRIPDDFRG